MIKLTEKWIKELISQPETGMGYYVVSIILENGERFDQVVVVDGWITEIRKFKEIPFSEDQVSQIFVTHDKWDFNAGR